MTTLANRPNSALLVVDVQNGVVRNAYGREAVVANIVRLTEQARRDGVPVVWVQHESKDLPKDSETWRIVPELEPRPDEPHIHKAYGDAFEDTDLEAVLADLEVGRLAVTGLQTDACIRSTIHGALARGYDVTLVSDAHTNLYWKYQTAPGRTAGVAKAAEVDLGAG